MVQIHENKSCPNCPMTVTNINHVGISLIGLQGHSPAIQVSAIHPSIHPAHPISRGTQEQGPVTLHGKVCRLFEAPIYPHHHVALLLKKNGSRRTSEIFVKLVQKMLMNTGPVAPGASDEADDIIREHI